MPVLHLADVPPEVYEELRRRAATHQTTTEAEAVELLRYSLARGTVSPSQAELLEECTAAASRRRPARRIAWSCCGTAPMIQPPIACVVDASVGVKLVLAETLSNEAHALFMHLAKDPAARFFTPDLFDIECANVLWKQVRRFGCPLADAQLHLAILAALAVQRVPAPTLTADALTLAAMYGISAYDACYVAVAQRLGVPLITQTSSSAAAMAVIPSLVVDLRNLTIPPPPP